MTRKTKTSIERSVKVGMKEVIDVETGIVSKVNAMEIKQVDFNWNKIWLGHLLDVLDVIGNKKIAIMNWLLENRDPKNNQIVTTQKIISNEMNVSIQTVSDTFKALQDANALQKIRNGLYILNPDIIWVGGNENRMDILLTYKSIVEIDDNKKEVDRKKSIEAIDTPKPKEKVNFPEVDDNE